MPSEVMRKAAQHVHDAVDAAILNRAAELLEGLSTDGIRKLLRVRELAKKIVKVDLRTSTAKVLMPVFVVDHEAAKELLEIL